MSRTWSQEPDLEPRAGPGAKSRNRSHEPEPVTWAGTAFDQTRLGPSMLPVCKLLQCQVKYKLKYKILNSEVKNFFFAFLYLFYVLRFSVINFENCKVNFFNGLMPWIFQIHICEIISFRKTLFRKLPLLNFINNNLHSFHKNSFPNFCYPATCLTLYCR